MRVLGLDARPSGWITTVVEDGRLHSFVRHATLQAALAGSPHWDAVAVNVPLGHDDPDGSRNAGRRLADEAARNALGAEAERIPWTPPLAVLSLPDLAVARSVASGEGWPEPSERLWRLRARVQEAAAARHAPLHEVNPELSFGVLRQQTGGTGPVPDRPRSLPGIEKRLRLLHTVGLRPARSMGGIGIAEPVEVLASTVAAWTAGRIANGVARSFPEAPARDPTTGRAVRLVA